MSNNTFQSFGGYINTMQGQTVNLRVQMVFPCNLLDMLSVGFDGGVMGNRSTIRKSWLYITQWGWDGI